MRRATQFPGNHVFLPTLKRRRIVLDGAPGGEGYSDASLGDVRR
jgi:hypothetical protein